MYSLYSVWNVCSNVMFTHRVTRDQKLVNLVAIRYLFVMLLFSIRAVKSLIEK